MTAKKKRFEVPHTYVLLLVMVLICALLALVVPALGSLMGAVAVSKVPFDRYLKWVAPLCAIWCLIGLVSVTGAVLINYGPF